MSLVGTLGRVALGIMVAKGVSKAMQSRSGGQSGGQGGLGGTLGGLLGGQAGGASGGARQGGGLSGGLGNLGSLLGGKAPGVAAGGAAGGALAGGLGGLLEQLGGGARGTAAEGATTAPPASGSLGDLLNRALQGEQVAAPDQGQEAHARLLIQAMINAAKADGSIDQDEQKKIVEHLGDDMTAEEREFVLAEMRAPLDLDGFVKSVPRGAEKQVYFMSLMAIELDHEAEAKYLDRLRAAMGLSEQDADAVHRQLGAPTLYS